ncbi:MAG: hypothetical protein ACW99R_10665 [Candidatus Hodarchaeales archaeon]
MALKKSIWDNWRKVFWVTLWVLVMLLVINQGSADVLGGPLPPL